MAIPLVIGGGIWAYRAYHAYRAAQAALAAARAAQAAQAAVRAAQAAKALDAIITAQNNAAAEAAAQEKAKTDAQAKADAAASSNCKDCDEDPDCETARENLKDALYGIRGEKKGVGRGLAERLCHWLHGTDEAARATHLKDVANAAARVARSRKWLQGTGDAPGNVTKDPTMKLPDKKRIRGRRLNKNCSELPEVMTDAKDLEKLAKEIDAGKSSVQPIPRADFAAECTKDALGLVNRAF